MPKQKQPSVRVRSIDTAFWMSVVILAVATVVVHVVSSRPDRSWMWGAHFYAFFPTWVLILATGAVAAVLLVAALGRDKLVGFLDRAILLLRGRRFYIAAAVSIVAGTVLFWTARICHTYLGDGHIIVEEIDTSRLLLEREPLSSLLQYAVYGTTKPWFDSPNRPIEFIAQDALAPGSVAAGLFFLGIAWLLASEIARLRTTREDNEYRLHTVLIWLAIVLQGYVQLFFGYIENYTFYAVGVVAYLWLALRNLRGASPLLHPALALLLCFALHLSSFVLGASFLVLVVAALLQRERRLRALRDLAITAGVAIGVALVFSRMRAGYNPFQTLISMLKTAFVHENNPGYMFSAMHVRDFFNEQLLIGPLGMFLFVAAAAIAPGVRGNRRGTALFFLLAGFGFLVACWLIGDSNLGYARDWDLLSHSGIVFTTGALALFFMQRMRRDTVAVAMACAVAVSAYHTIPWIATNTSEARSLARLKTLPLDKGRTEVVVSTWYRQRGDAENQRYWLQQALVKNPNNINAMYLLGALDFNSGHYQEAVASLEAALRLRPTQVMFRTLLVQSLYALNRVDEAIPHLEYLTQADQSNVQTIITLGEAYGMLGRRTEAVATYTRAEQLLRPRVEKHPNDSAANLLYGFTLFRCERSEESVVYLEKAVALDPQSRDGYCYLGYALRDVGRDTEAAERFRRCLSINPGFAARAEVESWLATR